MDAGTQFARALDAIDAANAADPNAVTIRGRTGPKELLHALLASEWVRALRPDAAEALLLAARGHHLRRWTVPRASAPMGRAGYLKWRKNLQRQHADELGALLRTAGYEDSMIARVQSLVRKEDLASDADAQTLEDALCLVFLETQLIDVAARLEPDTLARVLARTAAKMSAEGRAAIERVPLDATARAILDRAVGPAAVVHRYLYALRTFDWDVLATTLAPDIVRLGPYGDVIRERDAYAIFLRDTIGALSGYELHVERVVGAGSVVSAELSETVSDDDRRLRTDEAVIFDVHDEQITRIAVYLQRSRHL